jgi:hypothetical protein
MQSHRASALGRRHHPRQAREIGGHARGRPARGWRSNACPLDCVGQRLHLVQQDGRLARALRLVWLVLVALRKLTLP